VEDDLILMVFILEAILKYSRLGGLTVNIAGLK